jgi:hypothetical protein
VARSPAMAQGDGMRAGNIGWLRAGAAVAAVALGVATAGGALAQTVTLTGLDGSSVSITAAELAAMPHQTVTMADHGASHAYAGVPLGVLLAPVGAPRGEALHGKAMAEVVLVIAADGYRVVLPLADLDPDFHERPIILADSADGRPLDAHEGPFRLVVDGDKRPARGAREVTRLELRELP